VAARQPASLEQMYTSTAASEILDRRRELVATLRARGVLVIETTPGAVKADAMNEYLEVKARGLL
jgi:predicted nuclease with RNAse H fold